MTGCNKAWVKSVRRRSRATACKKAAGRAERGRQVRGLVKAADKGLAVSQVRAKAGQVVRVAVVKQVLEVRVVREGLVDRDQADRDQADRDQADRDQADRVDKEVPVAVEGRGPAAAVLARAVVVAVAGKNKCGPAGAK